MSTLERRKDLDRRGHGSTVRSEKPDTTRTPDTDRTALAETLLTTISQIRDTTVVFRDAGRVATFPSFGGSEIRVSVVPATRKSYRSTDLVALETAKVKSRPHIGRFSRNRRSTHRRSFTSARRNTHRSFNEWRPRRRDARRTYPFSDFEGSHLGSYQTWRAEISQQHMTHGNPVTH
ncbi:hypothetical protein AVEN_27391-1 [Araneus ventricosus]|uniref:Uncharacterized protein n=1 Tax=Araneus ventricosus TaxID=182803 RepID=A0A4Y2NK55_ARAVE|nr:hypothetical protein AVEN_27391-1 [Araneus ventricosus]